jgi:hypothetical protein
MTTDRVLPAIALPRPVRTRGSVPRTEPIERHVARPQHDRVFTTPARAAILFGTSAAAYAVSLAAVASFQATDDAVLAARRQPALEAIARSRAANDAVERTVGMVDDRMAALADRYAGVAEDLAAYERQVDELAALVADVQGSIAALPHRIDLPSLSIHGSVSRTSGRTATPPRTVTKTRASGG